MAPIRPDRPMDTAEAFDVLVEQATEYAIITLSPDGLIASWNQGAQRIKGYEREEIVGQHFSVLYLDADQEAGTPERLLAEARDLGRVSTQGWRRRKDGTQFWASVVITALRDEDGALRGFVKLTRDETDRRQAEEIMAQLRRLSETEATARQLGDTVISSLFKIGLSLEATVRMVANQEAAGRLTAAVDDIDGAIADIRRIVIFGAPPPD